jgi:hypothetical protein
MAATAASNAVGVALLLMTSAPKAVPLAGEMAYATTEAMATIAAERVRSPPAECARESFSEDCQIALRTLRIHLKGPALAGAENTAVSTKAAHPNRGCRSWGLKPPDSRRHLAM